MFQPSAIDETDRRREKQVTYREKCDITSTTFIRNINDSLATILNADYADIEMESTEEVLDFANQAELDTYIAKLETEMRDSAKKKSNSKRPPNSATQSKNFG